MINKAMILAAGFGTRLKPLTNSIPKALVPFRNGTMISYQVEKLKNCGITDITVNAHHFAELIEKYFHENDFGIKVNVIKEDKILGTGGGILNAEKFLSEDGGQEKSFLALNVDVFTDFDYRNIIDYHEASGNFATLLVQKRKTSRYLVLDRDMKLDGRIKSELTEENFFAFNGIHVISEELFNMSYPVKYLDIIEIYLDAAKTRSKTIRGFNAGNCLFDDIGKISAYEKYKSGD